MKKESTKLVKKKLELKKSTVAKFGMNTEQMLNVLGGGNEEVNGTLSSAAIYGNKCTSVWEPV